MKGYSLKKIFPAVLFTAFLILDQFLAIAQNQKILYDKPGSFKIVNNGIYLGGADVNGQTYTYTKSEADLNYKNLVSLINIFQKTPVLQEAKGFDGIAFLSSIGHNPKFDYGFPCRITFMFEEWLSLNGKIFKQTSEPPQWYLTINQTCYYAPTSSFNVNNGNSYNPTNPLYDLKKNEKATKALRELFWAPGKKENFAYGIDKYNDEFIIYNPQQLPYWSPVTIREVFRLYKDYYQLDPDKNASDIMLKVLEKEYNEFSEEELDKYAYASGGESVFRIGKDSTYKPVMRANPAYWNKKLPASSIQFMILEIPADKDDLKVKIKRLFDNNDGYYFVDRLLYELDLKTLVPAIDNR